MPKRYMQGRFQEFLVGGDVHHGPNGYQSVWIVHGGLVVLNTTTQ